MNKSSAAAIVEISRDKSRYHDQDLLLNGFIGRDGFTAKEVAYEVLGWIKESYGNAPKRAHDLQKMGYLERLGQKVCRQSGKEAHSFRITDAGLAHLREVGVVRQSVPTVIRDDPPAAVQDKGSRFAGLRDSLEA
jgi:DNA-binding PadR family transcriptional regulator